MANLESCPTLKAFISHAVNLGCVKAIQKLDLQKLETEVADLEKRAEKAEFDINDIWCQMYNGENDKAFEIASKYRPKDINPESEATDV